MHGFQLRWGLEIRAYPPELASRSCISPRTCHTHACVGTFRLPLDYVERSKPELIPEPETEPADDPAPDDEPETETETEGQPE